MKFSSMILLIFVFFGSALLAQDGSLNPKLGSAEYNLQYYEIDIKTFLAIERSAGESVNHVQTVMPVLDKNPIRRARLEKEFLSDVEARARVIAGRNVQIFFPPVPTRLTAEYDAARKAVTFILPKYVLFKFSRNFSSISRGSYEKKFVILFPDPIFGEFADSVNLNPRTSFCSDSFEFEPKDVTLFFSPCAFMTVSVDNLELAERLYDLSKQGRLKVEFACEIVRNGIRDGLCSVTQMAFMVPKEELIFTVVFDQKIDQYRKVVRAKH